VNSRSPAEVLREARRRDSLAKRQRVRAAIQDMLRSGDPVTFTAVARAAKVSAWLVYADGVREHVDAAIRRQSAQPAQDQRTGRTVSAASLRADLELARQQIRQLRDERGKLREHLRLQLGHQLDQLHSKTLIDRIDELTTHSQRLADQHRQATADNQQLRRRITELEDNLTAARTSLRRMIREENRAVSDSPAPG
jgi:DNA repair exonuclease SbcCD ATPase subunit